MVPKFERGPEDIQMNQYMRSCFKSCHPQSSENESNLKIN